MNAKILNEVRLMAADTFAIDASELTASSTPEQIEVWDSVKHLTLVTALEASYEIRFEPEEFEHMNSLGEIATLVETKIS